MVAESLAVSQSQEPQKARLRLLTPILLATLTFLSLLLRIALAGRSGIWRDEAQCVWVVRSPTLPAMLNFLAQHESHPPLFYLLLRGWLGIFGDSAAAALALPVLVGCALVPAAYCVGRRVFNQSTGLIAAALVATSPLLARYSAVIRPYSLLPLLCLLSVYTLWLGLKGQDRCPWVWHVIATLALLLSHNWSWVVVGAEWVVVSGWLICRRIGASWPRARPWLLAQFLLIAGFVPWIPVFLHQVRHAGYDGSALHPFLVFANFAETFTSLPVTPAVVVCTLLAPLAVYLAVVRRPAMLPVREQDMLALVLFLGIPLVAFAMATALSGRTLLLFSQCLAMTAPCILIAVADGISTVPRMSKVLALVCAWTYLAFSLALLGEVKSNAREAAALVGAQVLPTDLILITPVWHASPFNYYSALDNPQVDYPQEERVRAIDYADLRERLLDTAAIGRAKEQLTLASQEGRRVWLVTERDIQLKDVPTSERLPDSFQGLPFTYIGHVRANQLRKHLISLYGSPRSAVVPGDGRGGSEVLEVLLFQPLGLRPTCDVNEHGTGDAAGCAYASLALPLIARARLGSCASSSCVCKRSAGGNGDHRVRSRGASAGACG
jgi:uncharacterized membrane protein